jgi:hypothetical protein
MKVVKAAQEQDAAIPMYRENLQRCHWVECTLSCFVTSESQYSVHWVFFGIACDNLRKTVNSTRQWSF